jgi:hypothetical protein
MIWQIYRSGLASDGLQETPGLCNCRSPYDGNGLRSLGAHQNSDTRIEQPRIDDAMRLLDRLGHPSETFLRRERVIRGIS